MEIKENLYILKEFYQPDGLMTVGIFHGRFVGKYLGTFFKSLSLDEFKRRNKKGKKVRVVCMNFSFIEHLRSWESLSDSRFSHICVLLDLGNFIMAYLACSFFYKFPSILRPPTQCLFLKIKMSEENFNNGLMTG
ncbi:CLUMA_CG012847, isoform A [Clunio marinus]|uniref:CLUMA_CG012847, isoform A n=1 Tax=Clunio marinus TaxID=568069 RepID=A0A1J1IH45_9DIPT|nr:CLUMA_CG012847, isoform A [Clunio marinus]